MIEKIVLIALVFWLSIVAPLLLLYVSEDGITDKLVLNEVSQFIDKVTDKAAISESDLDDVYMGVNSHGGVFDVKVERYIRVATEGENGEVKTLYYLADEFKSLNIGDIVKVHVTEVGMRKGRLLRWSVLKLDNGKLDFSLAGTVR